MRSRTVIALAVALLADIVVIVLLTPLGFEDRPQTALQGFGYVAIGTIFAGLALYLASLGLLFRRARAASGLAIAASMLFFIPVVGDQAGLFFSVPIPVVINTLEYILVVCLVATIVLAWGVYRER